MHSAYSAGLRVEFHSIAQSMENNEHQLFEAAGEPFKAKGDGSCSH